VQPGVDVGDYKLSILWAESFEFSTST